MKKIKRALALIMALAVIMCMPMAASANTAEPGETTPTEGSISIYKYDLTGAEKDGVWDSSYVSTGVRDEEGVESILGGTTLNGDAYGYAIKGVEFSYLGIAEPYEFSSGEGNAVETEILYGIANNDSGKALLEILGVSTDDSVSAANTDGFFYFRADTLTVGLKAALDTNSTAVKNELETYMAEYGGHALDETDEYGHTYMDRVTPGLFLFVETKVPENVTETTAPFFVSMPMTSGDGSEFIYDITLYPKNITGMPTLDKTVRENKAYTGKNNGSDTISDGYAKTATASTSDVLDYQIISTLPSITSEATYLSEYSFEDTLADGISYRKNDVAISFYKDAACTDKIISWDEASGKFSVTYDGNKMSIAMTETGIEEINSAATVYTGDSMVNSGYSGCTMRISYTAEMAGEAAVAAGDKGNENTVVLTWKRSNAEYSDTLESTAAAYTYGVEINKSFRDGKGDATKVAFILHNDTDDYYITASKDADTGIYYAMGKAVSKENATKLIPNAEGKIVVKGLEDDEYSITETQTDTGYNILKSAVKVKITKGEESATATVSGKAVTMKADGESANAYAPLSVVNTRGFDLPQTGGNGTWMYPAAGIVAMGAIAVFVVIMRKKAKEADE